MTDCIEFAGYRATHKRCYNRAKMTYKGKCMNANRAVFHQCEGWWPKVVRHTCDNPGCVNPAHLLPGTQRDNVMDMVKRGRHPQAKLTAEQVLEIRSLHGKMSQREIARRYKIDPSMVSYIIRRKNWTHI